VHEPRDPSEAGEGGRRVTGTKLLHPLKDAHVVDFDIGSGVINSTPFVTFTGLDGDADRFWEVFLVVHEGRTPVPGPKWIYACPNGVVLPTGNERTELMRIHQVGGAVAHDASSQLNGNGFWMFQNYWNDVAATQPFRFVTRMLIGTRQPPGGTYRQSMVDMTLTTNDGRHIRDSGVSRMTSSANPGNWTSLNLMAWSTWDALRGRAILRRGGP
jgi:hypothetical protein